MANLMTKVPRSAQTMVATLVRTIFDQPDATQVWAQHARVVEQLSERFADAATMLVDAGADLLAFTAFPHEHWRHSWLPTISCMAMCSTGLMVCLRRGPYRT